MQRTAATIPGRLSARFGDGRIRLLTNFSKGSLIERDDHVWLAPPLTFDPHPAPFELKVPYVARAFTCRFQMIRRCDQSAVQQVFAMVRLINRSLKSCGPVRADAAVQTAG